MELLETAKKYGNGKWSDLKKQQQRSQQNIFIDMHQKSFYLKSNIHIWKKITHASFNSDTFPIQQYKNIWNIYLIYLNICNKYLRYVLVTGGGICSWRHGLGESSPRPQLAVARALSPANHWKGTSSVWQIALLCSVLYYIIYYSRAINYLLFNQPHFLSVFFWLTVATLEGDLSSPTDLLLILQIHCPEKCTLPTLEGKL